MNITLHKAKKYKAAAMNPVLPLMLILWPVAFLGLTFLIATSVNMLLSVTETTPGFVELLRIVINIALFMSVTLCVILGPISILAGIIILTIKRKLR